MSLSTQKLGQEIGVSGSLKRRTSMTNTETMTTDLQADLEREGWTLCTLYMKRANMSHPPKKITALKQGRCATCRLPFLGNDEKRSVLDEKLQQKN